VKRGDVYWATLDPRSGSEQKGRRPVIIVSHDGFNELPTWQSVIVIPCTTSARQSMRGPTAVVLPVGAIGTRHESVAICHQITTIDRSKLIRSIGSLSEPQLQAVEAGLRAAVDLVLQV
jgi:mRNA interferase MazF